MSDHEKSRFPFPFTAIPNVFLDEWQLILDDKTLRLMLVFFRSSFGWQHAEGQLSLSEIEKRAPFDSRPTAVRALDNAIDLKLLEECPNTGKRGVKSYRVHPALVTSLLDKLLQQMESAFPGGTGLPEKLELVHELYLIWFTWKTGSGLSGKPDESRKVTRQRKRQEASSKGKRQAKETSSKKVLNKEKDIPPQASPSAGASLHSRRIDVENPEEEKKLTPSEPGRVTMGRNATRQAAQGQAAPTAEVIKEPGAAERWWLRVKEDMQAQMTPAAWTSWFAPTRGLRLEGNTLVVQTPKGAQELFEHRWAPLIAAILERAARPGLHVRYTQEG